MAESTFLVPNISNLELLILLNVLLISNTMPVYATIRARKVFTEWVLFVGWILLENG